MSSFSYGWYFKQVQAKLGSDLKVAQDLAELLDLPFLRSEKRQTRHRQETICDMRLQVIEDLSAILHAHGMPVPGLEVETLRRARPKHLRGVNEAKVNALVRTWIQGHYGGVNMMAEIPMEETAKKVRATVEREVAAWPLHQRSEWLREYMARLNHELLDLGQPAVRPDYSQHTVVHSAEAKPPSRPLTVLLVDDDSLALAWSARPLAGYPDVAIEYLYFYTVGDEDELQSSDPRYQKLVEDTARQVITWKPDIVLMEEGLMPICGTEVITEIRRQQPGCRIRFVGNTGGAGDELESVGVYDNYDKGRNVYLLRRIISSL